MGIFGPGYKQIGDFFTEMIVKLTEDEDSGCKSCTPTTAAQVYPDAEAISSSWIVVLPV